MSCAKAVTSPPFADHLKKKLLWILSHSQHCGSIATEGILKSGLCPILVGGFIAYRIIVRVHPELWKRGCPTEKKNIIDVNQGLFNFLSLYTGFWHSKSTWGTTLVNSNTVILAILFDIDVIYFWKSWGLITPQHDPPPPLTWPRGSNSHLLGPPVRRPLSHSVYPRLRAGCTRRVESSLITPPPCPPPLWPCKQLPANTRHSDNYGSLLGHRLRRWPISKPASCSMSCLLQLVVWGDGRHIIDCFWSNTLEALCPHTAHNSISVSVKWPTYGKTQCRHYINGQHFDRPSAGTMHYLSMFYHYLSMSCIWQPMDRPSAGSMPLINVQYMAAYRQTQCWHYAFYQCSAYGSLWTNPVLALCLLSMCSIWQHLDRPSAGIMHLINVQYMAAYRQTQCWHYAFNQCPAYGSLWTDPVLALCI